MKKRLIPLLLALCLMLGIAGQAALAAPNGADALLGLALNNDPTVAAEQDKALDAVATGIDPALKAEIQAHIATIKDLRAQGDALTQTMKAQWETNKGLWQAITGQFAPARDELKQARTDFQAWLNEQVAPLKTQLADLQNELAAARQAKDKAAVQALLAELQSLRAQIQAVMAPAQQTRVDLQAKAEALKTSRAALQTKLAEVRALREQGKTIHQSIVTLRAQKATAWQAANAARQAKDGAALIAALDQVIELKTQILDDRQQILTLAVQIGAILATIK